jgi:hypothetical protein
MRRQLVGSTSLAAALLLLVASMAGSQGQHRVQDNRGAVLYFSVAPELRYDDTTSYRGLSANPRPDEAIVTTGSGRRVQVAYLMLGFPPEATPNLATVTFGIRYPKQIRIVRMGLTPPCLQMATRDWPASGEGMMFGLTGPADTSRVVELAWFAFEASGPGLVEVIPHPDPRNAIRIVGNEPPELVPLSDVGSLGFGVDGRKPVPSYPGPKMAACCWLDTSCLMLTRAEAQYYKDKVLYLGDDTDCAQVAICGGAAPAGGCCLPDGTCKALTNKECARAGGNYRGNDSLCDTLKCQVREPNPSERKGP